MIEFKPFTIDYAAEYSSIRNVPEVLDNGYDRTPNPFTEKDAVEYITKEIGKSPSERFFIFWNGKLAGEIGISIQEDVFRLNAEIGYFVGKEFWGQGIASKAVERMTAYAFDKFNIVRIVAGVFDFNKSSMKVLEKNGYYLECIRKNAVIKNGKIFDDYIWVKLKDETPIANN
ncbi:GNAT family N-acetyltransferase [Aureibacter tunicatorum]|uniref:RimJ/RimL family protein N-acetyltransferase n=1 Tax=Aureibacter tunicatorum TaxID=866807 RepID=A0AAE4BUW8_9BACT|nr:GNAT family protein [Aureibacter tunicatorum]MDR6241198.1 RimJ/RimL family protein N-acetyltransferase [Aureibacter tunicatorum]BDD03973.1 N-acetyltransferase [Aureibacter tunicatorum]